MKGKNKRVADLLTGGKVNRDVLRLAVKDVTDDTREVVNGTLFFAREKANFDVFSAINGIGDSVVAIVVDRKFIAKVEVAVCGKCPVIGVSNVDKAYRVAADRLYDFRASDFCCIGVTGTNGKTTVASLMYHIFTKLGVKTTLLGTVTNIVAGRKVKAVNTTADYVLLRKVFAESKAKGFCCIVMEVSSHGIAQDRIAGIKFNAKIFTNLSRDHIDYHKTMANYFSIKKNFMVCDDSAVKIVNSDDNYGRLIIETVKSITYSVKDKADFRATKISVTKKGVSFMIKAPEFEGLVTTSILGRYNVSNIMAAMAAVKAVTSFSLAEIVAQVKSFKGVKGRLTEVGDNVFLDYAHTPDALRKVLGTLRVMGYRNIILVFGCGGGRDKGKRTIMGRIAGRYAQLAVITSDNPRFEDAEVICRQIASAVNGRHTVIVDRKEAIGFAIQQKTKNAGSCVLVAGKGHERYQVIKSRSISFSDEKIIRNFLNDN